MPNSSPKTNGFAAKLGKSKAPVAAIPDTTSTTATVGEGVKPAPKAKRTPPPTPVNTEQPKKPKPQSRQGKRHISGHFEPAAWRQLRLIALEEETTTQALLEEALDLLFHARRMPTIATPVKEQE